MFSHYPLKIVYTLLTIFLLALALFNIFYGLSKFPIFSWDEARHGVSAYEMLKERNFIINTYKNKIDYWNLKPPLSFWMTIAGYKIAGFNTLGLRLFSAVFAILTILMVALFVLKKHGLVASFLSALSLTTSTQFLIHHSARTGDADSLFVFLFTSSILSMLLSDQNKQWLYVSGILFSLAFLTKSWHAGNIIIIISLYLLSTGTYRRIRYRGWFLLFACMVGPIILWGIIRYQYDGLTFFKNMITYDLLKRSSVPIEGHIGSTFYYFQIIWRFSKFWLMLLIGFLMIYLYHFKSKFIKPNVSFYMIGLCLWLVVPFTLYSIAETKIKWYILPIYPALSILIGSLGSTILQNGRLRIKIALLASILLISAKYESQIFTYLQHPIPKLHLNLVQKIQSIDEIKGFNLYIHQHSKSVWTQNTVLAAELFGDLKVKDGDFKSFLQKDRALLLLKKSKKTKQLIESHHLMIIASNKWGYIVRKPR
jgi:4-amino-4-deoxy-L-arabinose transferase-like glycosyltransferase